MKPKKRKFAATSVQGRNETMIRHLEFCRKFLISKAKDYGNDNFIHAAKIAHEITGLKVSPELVAACMLGIKFARYRELTFNNKTPVGESLDDTIRDAINYILLMDRERARQCKSMSTTSKEDEDEEEENDEEDEEGDEEEEEEHVSGITEYIPCEG